MTSGDIACDARHEATSFVCAKGWMQSLTIGFVPLVLDSVFSSHIHGVMYME